MPDSTVISVEKPSFRALRRAVFAVSLLFLVQAFMPGGPAFAQIVRTAKIEITDSTREIAIGSQIYLYKDKAGTLTYNAVIGRHMNNLRGELQTGDILTPGLDGSPLWMVFSVENRSARENWVLDFGAAADGRYGLFKALMVRNHSESKTVISLLGDGQIINAQHLQGSALPLHLPVNKTSLFVVYLQPENGPPQTLAPRLMTEDSYVGNLRSGDWIKNLTILLAVAMTGFFIALAYMKATPHYLFYAGYFALNGFVFYVLDRLFLASFSGTGELLTLLFVSTQICALFMSRHFLELEQDHERESYTLYALCGFLVFSVLLSTADINRDFPVTYFILFALVMLCILTQIFFSFLQMQRGHMGAPHYASSWLPVLAGFSIFSLGATGILEPGPLILNAYWLCLVPQAAFLAAGTMKRVQMMEDREHKYQMLEAQEAQTLAKLKQSKENADQARLLRVIEREREVLAELREKEIKRSEEMRIAMEKADEANRAKSAFLAVVSHEIRTPMTGIMGMVKLLLNTRLSGEQNDFVLAVQKSGDTMMALLNDILDFEKIESGAMALESIDFDLHKLVGGVVTLMSGQAIEKGLFLKPDIPQDVPRFVRGDPTRLRQVVLNLVNNAIKFTEKGGVTIHLRSTPLEEKVGKNQADFEIYLAVEDTGIGIAEDAQERLFSPFSQAEKSTTRKYGGTGLGLAICKKIIEAMGGKISVSSEPGLGSTFFFTLLMQQGQAQMAEETRQAAAIPLSGKPLNILIAEDNEMNRRVLTGFLESGGHKVSAAASGQEALEALQGAHYDALFSDINMGGMDGMELTRRIRSLADRRMASTPVIALTGNVRPEDVQQFYAANMNGFLAKPIDSDKLYATLEKIGRGELDNRVRLSSPALEDKEKPPAPATTAIQHELPPRAEKYDSYNFDAEEDDMDDFPMTFGPGPLSAKNQSALQTLSDNPLYKEIFDMDLITQLLAGLGAEQFKALMKDYADHAQKIIEALEVLKDDQNLPELKARAHELKGMAANFGIKSVSAIASQIEKSATAGDAAKALEALEGIFEANARANSCLKEWIEEML